MFKRVHGTLPKTDSSPLKSGGWEAILSFCEGLFSGEKLLVSGRVSDKDNQSDRKKYMSIVYTIPIASMYGIFTYIWLILMVKLHGSYGIYI